MLSPFGPKRIIGRYPDGSPIWIPTTYEDEFRDLARHSFVAAAATKQLTDAFKTVARSECGSEIKTQNEYAMGR